MAFAVLLLAYLVGSIPSGYLLVRTLRRLDVRRYGSHNVGAINVFRVGGPWLGLGTLLADTGKALCMVVLASALGLSPWGIAVTGLIVMLGHAYSAWFYLREHRFSEGKSVASCLGVLIGWATVGALPWPAAATPLAVWIAALLAPRLLTGHWPCISPATMSATVSVPVVVALSHAGPAFATISAFMALLILVRHKHNIQRLLTGTEPRLGERRTTEVPLPSPAQDSPPSPTLPHEAQRSVPQH